MLSSDNGICLDTASDFGGRCDCSNATGLNETEEWTLICDYGGPCFTEQEYEWCVGKDDRRPVGDGTWCYNDKRRTQCTTINERGTIDYYENNLGIL